MGAPAIMQIGSERPLVTWNWQCERAALTLSDLSSASEYSRHIGFCKAFERLKNPGDRNPADCRPQATKSAPQQPSWSHLSCPSRLPIKELNAASCLSARRVDIAAGADQASLRIDSEEDCVALRVEGRQPQRVTAQHSD